MVLGLGKGVTVSGPDDVYGVINLRREVRIRVFKQKV